jgi:purine nucleosidase
MKAISLIYAVALLFIVAACERASAQTPSVDLREKVIFDTDIGDDIDDAFALALAVSSPKLQVLGVTAAWGDTDLRARLAAGYLKQTGHANIPVFAGPKTHSNATFSQSRSAMAFPQPAQGWPDAIDFILSAIRQSPEEVTLISVSPLSNVGALIDKDPTTFRKLKRVVIMGGSIRRGYGDLGYTPDNGPSPEYNIAQDIPSARKLFASGVPLYVMPLDSTQLKLDEVLRNVVFSQNTNQTNALTLLYQQWTAANRDPTPTLFDAMAVAASIDADLCPTQPMRIEVDDKGYTRVAEGQPNSHVCLQSNSDRFFHFYIPAILGR